LRASGHEILSGLEQKGRILLFVDESGTSDQPLPNLEKDFMVFCGVEVASEDYSTVCMRMKEKLSSITSDVKEFHAVEIVNPKRNSPWHKATYQERIDSLMLLKKLFCDFCIRAPFCYISKDQYQALIKGSVVEGLSHKEGLKKVFFDRVFRNNNIVNENYAVIYDSEKKLEDKIKIQRVSLKPGSLYEDGIIIGDSKFFLGLQLVDFAVYVLNRMHHSVHRMRNAKENQFDKVILKFLPHMKDKYIKLLG
jgi:hypothetical protein